MKQRGATPEEDRANGWITEGVIKDVSGWSVTLEGGTGCAVRDVGVEPKVGDTLTIYGQFGYSFHGQALNGRLLWYLTPAEEEAERQQWLTDRERKQREEFEANREQLDRDYDSLPPLFKMRIDRFRKANPDFRWESESYEMFVCTQAVVLAEWAQEGTETPEEAVAKIEAWDKINSAENDPPYDYRAQVDAVPGWADGHSGSTHGCAVFLAKEHLTAKERVALQPGARWSARPTTPRRDHIGASCNGRFGSLIRAVMSAKKTPGPRVT